MPPLTGNYPSADEIASADRKQLCIWHRFLRSPKTFDEVRLNHDIHERWRAAGGFSPKISKEIGWE